MKKSIIALTLGLVLLLSLPLTALAAEGFDNFSRDITYADGKFADVSDQWFAASVKDAYELGLMIGQSESRFAPDSSVTLAEAITMACRLHSIYCTGQADFVQALPWYQPYVDYAVENGIIAEGAYADLNAVATRAQYAAIYFFEYKFYFNFFIFIYFIFIIKFYSFSINI